jgi:hydroxymethylpyrimidine pyrophosphatase-like HAD family hydrolase
MGNAHADVVAKADVVACSNDEDGVAVILESLL